MQWRGRQQSSNVEDRRGMSGGKVVGGGIGALVVAAIVYFLGGDPSQVLQSQQMQNDQQVGKTGVPANDTAGQFISVVLADTEQVWDSIFNTVNKRYTDPTLVLFTDATSSACGSASSATGPFYCPGDQKVYIDLSFFDELTDRFGAEGGDFAKAYVLAHEVGHHVQDLLGISDKVEQARRQLSETEYNKLSVKLELQADFFAGVWAHCDQKMNHVLEAGDIDEALSAASAVGDDRLQKAAQGYVVPDAFTHGTSAQRQYWFKKGFDTGDINQGNTFDASDL